MEHSRKDPEPASLDGGGIKGLFSAAVLAHLEGDLGIRITDHFDLITGTSTGGIIALGLGLGLRPREIVTFYSQNGRDIFKSNWIWSRIKHRICRKYSSKPLRHALQTCFKDKLLGDRLKPLVIPAYNIGEDGVYLFKTPHHPRFKRDYRVPAWKVAMATSAAPTYLPSFREVDHVRLIDGGVWANNPIMLGIVEAVSMLHCSLDHIRVFSLGTSDSVEHHPDRLNWGGLLQWAMPSIKIIMRAQSIGALTQAQHLIGKDHVLRVDPKVPDGPFALDRLANDGLLGMAADKSREYSSDFERMFASHYAREYRPQIKQSECIG